MIPQEDHELSPLARIERVEDSPFAAMELPTLVRVGRNLILACFPLMKLLPARYILEQAIADEILHKDKVVVESSSGTFGLALAMVCAYRRLSLHLVSDPVIDARFQTRLEQLGARVDIVRNPNKVGGFQQARLDRLSELRNTRADYFWPNQYDNKQNPESYAKVARVLSDSLGEIDQLVGSVGSGGSVCGTANALRTRSSALVTTGVDTFGSVLFGLPDSVRTLRGLGNSIMPKCLDHSVFDAVHWVSPQLAFSATRKLWAERALYLGPTSGAVFVVAQWCARANPDALTVALMPDDGHRYQDTIYSDAWLEVAGIALSDRESAPVEVGDLNFSPVDWAYFPWKRRSLEAVLSGS